MKIGDKVRCVNSKEEDNLTEGNVYQIIKIENQYNVNTIIITDDDGYECEYLANRFELADEFEPTKSYLMKHKDEYFLEVADGEIYKVDELELTEELREKDGNTMYDIVKIHKKNTVWKRDTRRELTIEEAEKEFNIRIKGEKR